MMYFIVCITKRSDISKSYVVAPCETDCVLHTTQNKANWCRLTHSFHAKCHLSFNLTTDKDTGKCKCCFIKTLEQNKDTSNSKTINYILNLVVYKSTT